MSRRNQQPRSRVHAHLTPINHSWEHKEANKGRNIKDSYRNFADCNFSRSAVISIEKMTRGQSSNDHWVAFRKGAITASCAKDVVTRTKSLLSKPYQSPEKIIEGLIDREPVSTRATVFGHEQEHLALSQYFRIRRRHHVNFSQRVTGLYICRDHPLMGASPDAVCYCQCNTHPETKWIVEVKSIYKYRYEKAWDAALKHKVCFVTRSGRLGLDWKHHWYYQIQMQMGCVGVRRCDLVIRTENDIVIVPVYFNWYFYMDMMASLRTFAEEFLYPHLYAVCDKKHDTAEKTQAVKDLQNSQKPRYNNANMRRG